MNPKISHRNGAEHLKVVLEEFGEREEVEISLVEVDLLDFPEILRQVGQDSRQRQVLLGAAQIGHCP